MLTQSQSNFAIIRWAGAEYKTWIEVVTPERAEHILKGNEGRNRKRRANRVARYAADMRTGKWRLTGETIRLDEEGVLLNGQHRLAAVALSRCSVPMMFVSGISHTTMLVQDTGLPTASEDWSPLESAAAATKVVRAVLRPFAKTLSSNASRDEIVAAYNIIGGEHIQWAIAMSTGSNIARRASLRAALSLMHKVNPERAALFAKRITEHDLPGGSPESVLHRAMTDGSQSADRDVAVTMRSAVSVLRDNDKGAAKLYEIGDRDRAWLIKAAGLEKLLTLRKDGTA